MKNVSQHRRAILKGALAVGAISSIGAGLAYAHPTGNTVWPKEAFNARSVEEALLKLMGDNTVISGSDDLMIAAPVIAENGIAHITIDSQLPGTESISIFIPNNRSPLVAHFKLDQKTAKMITTRIKIENSGEIVVIASASNRLYSSSKKIRTVARQE
ncbi:MAG: hypothetical protein L3J26_07370 [Candidatus Polarisedimenticolaceae bacterium]|nr:hypothetical protein [Candidatus Polarisedimenticolaceae bacterium]